jgi:hypothetical protein
VLALLASPEQPVEGGAASACERCRVIDSLPVTWQAFWKLADDPEQFGEYAAPAKLRPPREFKCGRAMLLLDKDPL